MQSDGRAQGGLEFFTTQIESAEGDLDLLQAAMGAMLPLSAHPFEAKLCFRTFSSSDFCADFVSRGAWAPRSPTCVAPARVHNTTHTTSTRPQSIQRRGRLSAH